MPSVGREIFIVTLLEKSQYGPTLYPEDALGLVVAEYSEKFSLKQDS